MSGADVLLAVLAMGVAVLLARGSHPLVQLLLVASALAVSAILFLPTAMLADLIGMPRVDRLYGFTRGTPLDPPEWIHVAAFAWLGGLVWLARPGWRTWQGAGGILLMCAAAEVAQWLADGRQPGVGDAALNMVGGLAGILLAHGACLLAGWGRRRRRRSPTGD